MQRYDNQKQNRIQKFVWNPLYYEFIKAKIWNSQMDGAVFIYFHIKMQTIVFPLTVWLSW